MEELLPNRAGLSLERLRSLMEIDSAGGIARAARSDVSRQALMSRQLRELEEYFGAELTERRGKTLVLTPAGRRLAALAREQYQDLAGFYREQHHLAKAFRLGAGASVLEWLVLPAAARLRSVLGNAVLHFSSRRSRELVEEVRDGRLDFAVVRETALPESAPRLPLLRLLFLLCVPLSLVRAKSKSSSWQAAELLRGLPFAGNAGGGLLDQAFRSAMRELLGDFAPAYECDSLLQVRKLVQEGHCAGVLPSIGVHGLAEAIVHQEEFEPMKNHGRLLVLHWNSRHMSRRGLEERQMAEVAEALTSSHYDLPVSAVAS